MKTTSNYNLSNLMKKAWMLVKSYGFTLAEALKQSWAIAKLNKAMKGGIVKFMYQKLDGSIRTAWGTLSDKLIGETKGTGRKPNESLVVYYDTEKSAYRSFKAANFIKMA